jgi:hypothetical protein
MNTTATTTNTTPNTFTSTFTKVPNRPRCYAAIRTIHLQNEYTGHTRTVRTALRIDGTEGAYRVDSLDYMIWVAIDDGRGFRTVAEAKRYAIAWCALAAIKGTLSPDPRELRATFD